MEVANEQAHDHLLLVTGTSRGDPVVRVPPVILVVVELACDHRHATIPSRLVSADGCRWELLVLHCDDG